MTIGRWVRSTAIALFLTAATIVVFEGASSLLLVARRLLSIPAQPLDRKHTQYDAALGWVGTPNLTLRDFYGPGMTVRTNSRGFRDTVEFVQAIPPNRLRVLCAGDSFTFGYGVADGQPWCKVLSALDRRLETFNLGQVGYGIDQSYLLYRRAADAYDHDIICFAFITDDFLRMQLETFLGAGKPRLAVRGRALVTENVPVPHAGRISGWMARAGPAIAELRSAQLVATLSGAASRRRIGAGQRDSVTYAVAQRVFEELAAVGAAKKASVLLIYLPTIEDYAGHASDAWLTRVHESATRNGWNVLDAVDALRRLHPDSVGQLFLPPGQHPLRSPKLGHLSVAGNRWVAGLVGERLRATPAIARRLAAIH